MHIERHDAPGGGKVLLYTTSGTIEVDAAAIQSFETEEAVAKPVAPAAAGPNPIPQVVPAQGLLQLDPKQLADAAAAKYGLPKSLVRSVMHAESGFQAKAVSPKGAIGLMQLMPGTAQTLGVDPKDPAQNVDAGARYLRDLLVKYNGGLWHALAAYNAGPQAVAKYGGVPPYRETIQYVRRIAEEWKKTN